VWRDFLLTSIYGATPPADPEVTTNLTSVPFGNQPVGTASAAQSVTLSNSGNAPLTINNLSITGTNAGDFSQTTTCPVGAGTLAAAASCTISVTFTPTVTGARSAGIAISDNGTGGMQTVALSGTGGSSAPTVSIAAGWNLVDLPSSGSGIRTAADLVTSLNGSLGAGAISLIATYANGRYSTYLPGYSTPQALSSTQGIYVLSTTSGTWAPPGSAYTSGQAIALLAGWNLVAAPFPAAGLVTTAIATEAAGCSVQTIVVYQNGSYQSWTPVATPFTVPSTAGMWLQCANSSTWTPS
jgi:hypothetical protein